MFLFLLACPDLFRENLQSVQIHTVPAQTASCGPAPISTSFPAGRGGFQLAGMMSPHRTPVTPTGQSGTYALPVEMHIRGLPPTGVCVSVICSTSWHHTVQEGACSFVLSQFLIGVCDECHSLSVIGHSKLGRKAGEWLNRK